MKALFDAAEAWHDRSTLYDDYRRAEDRYNLTGVQEWLGRQFSFADNTQEAVHGWYMFKEGFSHNLVGLFINEYLVTRGLVVDPFSGSGTTALHAQLRGLAARGVEVNPFFASVGATKLRWHEADISSLRALIDRIFLNGNGVDSPGELPELTSFKRLYSEEVLAELFRLKSRVTQETEPGSFARDFLLLGLTSILELTSSAYKTGKGLKFRKRREIHSIDDVRQRVANKWERMLCDVKEVRGNLQAKGIVPGDACILRGDARALPLDDDCAELIIYSPPYANTFDYNEVYKLEMWFMDHVKSYEEWRKVKEASLRSHVSLRIESQADGDELLEKALSFVQTDTRGEVQMLRAYFSDMGRALAEQRRVAKKGAHVVIIVGNSSYRCVPIATDVILARLAEATGFKVESIRVGRRLNTSSQQMAVYNARDPEAKAMRFIRESAVVLRR